MIKLWRIDLPYCLKKLNNGYWIFLNREYKPIGYASYDWIDYLKHPSAFKFRRDPTEKLKKICKTINEDKKNEEISFYFYDDSCKPYSSTKATQSYFERLKKIYNLSREK